MGQPTTSYDSSLVCKVASTNRAAPVTRTLLHARSTANDNSLVGVPFVRSVVLYHALVLGDVEGKA